MSRTNHKQKAKNSLLRAPYCQTKRGRGECPWCKSNFLHKHRVRELSVREQLNFGSVA